MTAEIAILNKSAVALAADSAVTISAGNRQEKIFDSADKLFELSTKEPIAIMVYNGMSFMQLPFPTLIRQFRECSGSVKTVAEASENFLEYLNNIGKQSPKHVLTSSVTDIIHPILNMIYDQHQKTFYDEIFSEESQKKTAEEISQEVIDRIVDPLKSRLTSLSDATFIGKKVFRFDASAKKAVRSIVDNFFVEFTDEKKAKLIDIAELILRKKYFSANKTGIIIAGFGHSEIFPTLAYYEIDGMVCGGLKYQRVDLLDIDRDKLKAVVLPFAQKEMVDRFLYGLDDEIKTDITKFCRESVGKIGDAIFSRLDIEDQAAKDKLESKAQDAENTFINSLESRAFDVIREKSKKEIEDIVEFMPKPELAKMAEALVELTSIKRRVFKGMETVGGPIDVAVISKTEGFVWIKRKHYFPAELNARYFERIKRAMNEEETKNE